MAQQQLVDYIKAQSKAGVAKAEIQKAVIASGWPAKDAAEAFAAAEGTPLPAVPTPAPTPIAVQPQPLPVIQMHPHPEELSGRSFMWIVWLVVLLVLVAGAAAAYFLTPIGDMVRLLVAPEPPAIEETLPPPPSNQTHTDPLYGFSVTYPNNLSPLPNTGDVVFALPGFSVSATTSPKGLATCALRTTGVATTTINGIDFVTQPLASTTTSVYVTTHAGACLTLEVLGSGTNSMLQSFRFVATSTNAATSTTVAP